MVTFNNVSIVGVYADNGSSGPQILWREAPGGGGFLGWMPVFAGPPVSTSAMIAIAIAAFTTGKQVTLVVDANQVIAITLIG